MSEQSYKTIGDNMQASHGTISGQMFGKPCLKINGKAFAAFFKGEMVFKLGRVAIEAHMEQYPGSVNWDPSGKKRPMKDWLQVPPEYEQDWPDLAEEAAQFCVDAK